MDDIHPSILRRIQTPRPKHLFRFRSVNANTLAALQQNKFWFSTVDRFNDPNEFAFSIPESALSSIDSFTLTDDGRRIAEEAFSQFASASEINYAIDRGVDHFRYFVAKKLRGWLKSSIIQMKGVCCFFAPFEESDLELVPVRKMLFWSHYAGNHHGFALRLNVEKITKLPIVKVDYLEKPPVATLSTDLTT